MSNEKEFSFFSKTFVYRKPATIWKVVRIVLYIYLGIALLVVLLEGIKSIGDIIKPILPPLLVLGISYSMANRSDFEKIMLTVKIKENRIQAIYGAQDVGDGGSPKVRVCEIPIDSIKAYEYSIPLSCIRIVGDWVVHEYDNTMSIDDAKPIRTLQASGPVWAGWKENIAGTPIIRVDGDIDMFIYLEHTSADGVVDAIIEVYGENPRFLQTPFLPMGEDAAS